ncbi:unnamed protein product [Paramecium sonneborni]|uniref:Uncharacterized protein n=1 Tax=Paramecium sonneborni TaxID=65129 RepID=A0A8S1NQH1_9CILI|nr:unnamed protein product [Paramecium sonneborni]
MKELFYQQYIYKRVQNKFIADIDLLQKLKELNVSKYVDLKRDDDDLCVIYKFGGDEFISLSDLMNLKTLNRVHLTQQQAYKILNSILIEFQKKYRILGIDFDPEDIWIRNVDQNQQQNNIQVFDVVFTSLMIFNDEKWDKQLEFNSFISLFKKLLILFMHESDIDKLIKNCSNFEDIQSKIQQNQDKFSPLVLVAKMNQKLIDVLEQNNSNKIYQCIKNKENYQQLISNIVNWVVKGNIYFDQTKDFTIKDIFEKLQFEALYQMLITWENVDYLILQLQMLGIFSKQSNLRKINDFIFCLTFPKLYGTFKNYISMDEANKLTEQWFQYQEQIISEKIQLYIKNIFTFYKGDKEEWEEEDYKKILQEARESIEQQFVKENYHYFKEVIQSEFYKLTNTLDIIKNYYEKKVNKINEEILEIIFQ